MANRHRGEVSLALGGRRLTLRLTLGALAELEDALGAGDLGGLAARLGSGRLSAADLVRIVGIAARAAGEELSDEEIAAMAPDGGLGAVVAAVVELFALTFGEAEPNP